MLSSFSSLIKSVRYKREDKRNRNELKNEIAKFQKEDLDRTFDKSEKKTMNNHSIKNILQLENGTVIFDNKEFTSVAQNCRP